jgi:hypothetical protein
MFRWKEEPSEQHLTTLGSRLDAMAALPGVVGYQHGPDAGLREDNWDYCVVGEFEDDDAYRAYASNADHQDIIATLIAPHIEARSAVQYRI